MPAFGPALDEIFIGVMAEQRLRREVNLFNGRFGWAYNPALFNCQFFVLRVAHKCNFEAPVKKYLPMGSLWKMWAFIVTHLHWLFDRL